MISRSVRQISPRRYKRFAWSLCSRACKLAGPHLLTRWDTDCPGGGQQNRKTKPEIRCPLPGDLPVSVRGPGYAEKDHYGYLGLSALAWACAIGPLYGILLVDYYVIKKEQIDLYSMSPNGRTGTGRGESESGKCANFGVYDRLYFYHGTSFNVAQGFSLFIRAGLAVCSTSCSPEAPQWRLPRTNDLANSGFAPPGALVGQ